MKKTNFVLLALLAGLGGIHADAGTVPAVETTDGTAFTWRLVIGADQSATMGWSFVVGSQNLELNALGIYDQGADGLQTSHGSASGPAGERFWRRSQFRRERQALCWEAIATNRSRP